MKHVNFPDVMEAIYRRRSVRKYTGEPVKREVLMEALKAASWAPSGLNNQPWRFAIIWDQTIREKIGSYTRYGNIIKQASVAVAVFLDHNASYDRTKDCQAIGACIQNFLLALHAMGLGAVWIGEILKNKDAVRTALNLPENLELMAVVAIGHPASSNQTSSRKSLEELIVLEL